MPFFIHLGHSRSSPKMLLQGQPAMSGSGFAGAKKKDVGSMKSISGAGVHKGKKFAPLRFKM
jgi:hypothetical protein